MAAGEYDQNGEGRYDEQEEDDRLQTEMLPGVMHGHRKEEHRQKCNGDEAHIGKEDFLPDVDGRDFEREVERPKGRQQHRRNKRAGDRRLTAVSPCLHRENGEDECGQE